MEVNNGGCGGNRNVRVTLKLRFGMKNLMIKSCIGGNDFLGGATLLHIYHSAVGTFSTATVFCFCILSRYCIWYKSYLFSRAFDSRGET